jgi:hypothetical protein
VEILVAHVRLESTALPEHVSFRSDLVPEGLLELPVLEIRDVFASMAGVLLSTTLSRIAEVQEGLALSLRSARAVFASVLHLQMRSVARRRLLVLPSHSVSMELASKSRALVQFAARTTAHVLKGRPVLVVPVSQVHLTEAIAALATMSDLATLILRALLESVSLVVLTPR